jgi:hypothetical protein
VPGPGAVLPRAQVLGLSVLDGDLRRLLRGLCLAAMPTRDETAALTPWAGDLAVLLDRPRPASHWAGQVRLTGPADRGPADRGPACREQMTAAFRRLVARAGPLLVLLEDLDGATREERALWRCLTQLAGRLPVVVVGTATGPGLAAPQTMELYVEPLADGEVGEIVGSALLGAGEDLVDAVVRQAAGMPGRAWALLQAVAEATPAGRAVA